MLHINPDREPDRARVAYDTHLARATWMMRWGIISYYVDRTCNTDWWLESCGVPNGAPRSDNHARRRELTPGGRGCPSTGLQGAMRSP